MEKVSICVQVNSNEQMIHRLIHSLEIQTYSNIECIIFSNLNVHIQSDKIQIVYVENNESRDNVLKHSSSEYIMYMHPNDYLFEEQSLEKMVSELKAAQADVFIPSFVQLNEGNFYFHHYGDNLDVMNVYHSNLPILSNLYQDFQSIYGLMFKKQLLQKIQNSMDIVDLLKCSVKPIFDKKAYYIVQENIENSLSEKYMSKKGYPAFVKKYEVIEEIIPDKISIAMCVDDNYGVYLPALLNSIDQNQTKEVDIYLLYAGLSVEMLELIYKLNQSLNHINLILKKIPSYLISQLEDIKTEYTGLAVSTYYRLFISELLPHLNRVLYMDIDMLVLRSLDNLWQTKFDGNYLVAVNDLQMVRQENYWGTELLGKDYKRYFNNGLLLMNLKAFRENQIFERLLKFIKENYLLIRYDDQDTFNVFFKGAVKYQDVSFNYMPMYLELEELPVESLNIVHYCGYVAKPWQNYSNVGVKYSYLKNLFRKANSEICHKMNQNSKILVFTDLTSNLDKFKHKLESILMQRYANLEIYVLQNAIHESEYIQAVKKLFENVHFISMRNQNKWEIMKQVIGEYKQSYVYSIWKDNYLDTEIAFSELISIVDDENADFIISTYKKLIDGNFHFYPVNNQLVFIEDEISQLQNKDFDLLNRLEGILIKSELLDKVIGDCKNINEKKMLEEVYSISNKKYYLDSSLWIRIDN